MVTKIQLKGTQVNKPTLTTHSTDEPVDNWSWFSTLEEDEVKTKGQPKQSDYSVGLENEGWSDKEQPKKTQDKHQVQAWGLTFNGTLAFEDIYFTRSEARGTKKLYESWWSDQDEPINVSVRKLLITVL